MFLYLMTAVAGVDYIVHDFIGKNLMYLEASYVSVHKKSKKECE